MYTGFQLLIKKKKLLVSRPRKLLITRAFDALIVRFDLYDIVFGYKFLVKFAFLLASIDLFSMNLCQTLQLVGGVDMVQQSINLAKRPHIIVRVSFIG